MKIETFEGLYDFLDECIKFPNNSINKKASCWFWIKLINFNEFFNEPKLYTYVLVTRIRIKAIATDKVRFEIWLSHSEFDGITPCNYTYYKENRVIFDRRSYLIDDKNILSIIKEISEIKKHELKSMISDIVLLEDNYIDLIKIMLLKNEQ